MLLTNYQQGKVKVPCQLVNIKAKVRPVKHYPALELEFLDNNEKSFVVNFVPDEANFDDTNKEISYGNITLIDSIKTYDVILACFGNEYDIVKSKLLQSHPFVRKITLLHIIKNEKTESEDIVNNKLERDAYTEARNFGFQRINYQIDNPFNNGERLFVYFGETKDFEEHALFLTARFPSLSFETITVKFEFLHTWYFYSMSTSKMEGSHITIYNYNNYKKALDNFKFYLPTIAKFYN